MTERQKLYRKEKSGEGCESDRLLRRLFDEYDRLSLFLARFLTKKSGENAAVQLESVERIAAEADFSEPESFFCPIPIVPADALEEAEESDKIDDHFAPDPSAGTQIDRRLLTAILERMTGSKEFQPGQNRALTRTEERLALSLIAPLAEIFSAFWLPEVQPGEITIDENGLSDSGRGSKNRPEPLFRLIWKARLAGKTFSIALILPESRLSFFLPEKTVETPEAPVIDRKRTELRVLAGLVRIPSRDFRRLAPGDLIRTTLSADAPFMLFDEKEPIFHVRPGSFHQLLAIEILDPIDKRKE